MQDQDLKQYLERIGFTGPLKPDLPTLRKLQECHLLQVPFENLDIQLGIPIILDTTRFFQKIVAERRGGYCYEVNGLFRELLLATGFKACLASARIARGRQFGEAFDHLVIIVDLDGRQWLVDAGYGDFSIAPLQLGTPALQSDGRNDYFISGPEVMEGEPYYTVGRWNKEKAGNTKDIQYYFDLKERTLSDFTERNHYQQSHPDSHFTKSLILSIPTLEGRLSLVNHRLVTTSGKERSETHVDTKDLPSVILGHFGIRVPVTPANTTEFLFRRSLTNHAEQ